MELSDLKTGTKLEIELLDNSGARNGPPLVSELEWVEDSGTAVIAAPIREGRLVPLRPGAAIYICFTGSERGLVNRYGMNAVVLDRGVSNNLYLLKVGKRSEIEKIQRRRYFRLDCYVDVRYRVVEPAAEGTGGEAFNKTFAVNLSGGGICVKTMEKIRPESLVECEIYLDGSKKIKFFGKVVRSGEVDMESRYRYEAGITYLLIDDVDREAIIRYIFNEQRKLLNKGLSY